MSTICPSILGKVSQCAPMNKLLSGPDNIVTHNKMERENGENQGLNREDERITSSLGMEVCEGEGGKV